ncbi:hypothetical protein VZ95_12700 [Elstera litoralis]|uniref:Uncharacterized protein n=1 Tax=Elstera litoralis TaxID=552518 RepID=A0A0F3IUH2_9PROT|nr:hypothetical protein [Elstera litoralis]KJV09244.1 hypothetical protein VZ95_12700 [Elstera litoralis]
MARSRFHPLCKALLAGLLLSVSGAYAQLGGNRTEAKNCAQAVAGSVTNSTLTTICGISPAILEALVEEFKQARADTQALTASLGNNIALLREKLDLSNQQIFAAFKILGEKNVKPEDVQGRLIDVFLEVQRLRSLAELQPGDSPNVLPLRQKAKKILG